MTEASALLPRVRDYLGASDARPFFELLAETVGLTRAQSPLGGDGHTDPLALMQQKAEQDLALKIMGWGGWSLRATPPQRIPQPASERKLARTDGDEGHG